MASGQCIPLRGSTVCPAFNSSSVSTGQTVSKLFPFLSFVSDVRTFDEQFNQYISTAYSQNKYQYVLGCQNVNLSNTTNIYARYTSTFLCNAIVQNSIQPCGLSAAASRPMCADSCADFAKSEERIASAPELCGTSSDNALREIRADFTNCALPQDALTAGCISGYQNEPNNCGFRDNLPSLCSYCAASSPNSTDSCCINSQSETRCQNVRLPITTSMGTLFPTSSGNSSTSDTGHGLSGGAIAGIVVGSIVGAFLLLATIIGACLIIRKRRTQKAPSIFNQPSPTRGPVGPAMSYSSPSRKRDLDLPHGARIHQMTALEGSSSNGDHASPLGAGFGSQSGYDDTPGSNRSGLGLAAGLAAGAPQRGGSLSRHTDDDASSPNYGSSPEGMASGQSEQMSHFKDYYSSDDIHPGDTVATLWAYQPRAGDEWDLDRGDMLKIVGIWDDGWATGYKISERAEEWDNNRNENRDSGVSHGSHGQRPLLTTRPSSEPVDGEIKAFPLVCVCLPQHWRKTIESDAAGEGLDPGVGNSPPNSP